MPTPSPLRISFARLCRDTRVMLDITQAELAAAVGVSRSHLAEIETGKADTSLDLAWAIADRLGIDLQLVGQNADRPRTAAWRSRPRPLLGVCRPSVPSSGVAYGSGAGDDRRTRARVDRSDGFRTTHANPRDRRGQDKAR
jgi:DNA-binding XRE family transcriptional regulator